MQQQSFLLLLLQSRSLEAKTQPGHPP
jgi:hypothetical protein